MPILFREEVQAELNSSLGVALPSQPPHLSVIAWCLVLLTGAGAAWLLSRSYADKVAVAGRTTTNVAPLEILSVRSGRVTSVEVELGARVAEGQRLLAIESEPRDAMALTASEREHAGTADRLARLNRQRNMYLSLRAEELKLLEDSEASLKRRVDVLAERDRVIRRRLASVSTHRARTNRIAARGWIATADRERAERDYLAERRLALDHRLDRLGAEDALGEVQRRIAIHQQETALEDHRIHDAWAELVARMGKEKVSAANALTAPRTGVVADVAVQPGTSVAPGQLLMTLADAGDALAFELWLPSRGAGRVRLGQRVRLQLVGFPHQEFGSVEARVAAIAGTSRTLRGDGAFRLLAKTISRPPGIDRVPPGMAVSGAILLEERRLWRWLLAPLISAWSQL